ncbi:hypothetical protein HPB47_012936 [Ixodes persulcatus]|uniref:Uncharacterized protein n=1 Tax=Ixodes persulcatus TaxID=34615 RepID=A0AC60NS45_IXOPE|nr:hypothetical protein HPB47_012936 [Ixodes persulcatus]
MAANVSVVVVVVRRGSSQKFRPAALYQRYGALQVAVAEVMDPGDALRASPLPMQGPSEVGCPAYLRNPSEGAKEAHLLRSVVRGRLCGVALLHCLAPGRFRYCLGGAGALWPGLATPAQIQSPASEDVPDEDRPGSGRFLRPFPASPAKAASGVPGPSCPLAAVPWGGPRRLPPSVAGTATRPGTLGSRCPGSVVALTVIHLRGSEQAIAIGYFHL